MNDDELTERIARRLYDIFHPSTADTPMYGWDKDFVEYTSRWRALAREILPLVKGLHQEHPKCYCVYCRGKAEGLDKLLRPWIGENEA